MNEMTSLKSMVSGEVLSWFTIMVFCCFSLLEVDELKVGKFEGYVNIVLNFDRRNLRIGETVIFSSFNIISLKKN